jgi:signal transduction histidine kinase
MLSASIKCLPRHRAMKSACLVWIAAVAHCQAQEKQDASGNRDRSAVAILSVRYGEQDFNLRTESGFSPVVPQGGDGAIVHRYAALRLSNERGRLAIGFGASAKSPKFAARLQYKLEGHDSEWRDSDRASMHLVVKFLDANRTPVSRAEFRVTGDAAGWSGRLEESTLATRTEETEVPPRAAFASIWIDSGGHDENSGVWLVDDLRIFDLSVPDGAKKPFFEETFENGRDLEQPQGDFSIWVRDGGALEGALVHQGAPARKNYALRLVDSNPLDYSAWRLKDQNLVPVTPGHRLKLEWKEVYSLGLGRSGQALYADLPYGQYQFRVRSVDGLGKPTGEQAVLPIVVEPPFYASIWSRVSAVASAIVLVLLVERLISRARTRRKLQQLERKQAVEEERARIARDIHDELGTVLSRISMASESASLEAEPGSSQQRRLGEICEASRDLTRTMEQIVWAQNPVHDSIDNAASYFASFATDLLFAAGISCRLDIPLDLPSTALEAEKRHELFLVFKEALNNIIKHSSAREAHVSLRIAGGRIVLVVEDNGCGFNPDATGTSKGNGLSNMNKRLQKLDGSARIVSVQGKGTRVEFCVPLSPDSDKTESK